MAMQPPGLVSTAAVLRATPLGRGGFAVVLPAATAAFVQRSAKIKPETDMLPQHHMRAADENLAQCRVTPLHSKQQVRVTVSKW